jgi:hypothetical protein
MRGLRLHRRSSCRGQASSGSLPPRSYYYVKSYAEGSGVIHLAAGIV